MSDVQQVKTLKVVVYSLTSLIVSVTLGVGVTSNSILMFSFLAASLAASLIGAISVFMLVVLTSPNHVSYSNSPGCLENFQEKIQVLVGCVYQVDGTNLVLLPRVCTQSQKLSSQATINQLL